ncbi:MAG: hypothetical protein IKC22_03905 [Bacilli bacterium]|nr:hypothetical protein [Bacilli bacterium]
MKSLVVLSAELSYFDMMTLAALLVLTVGLFVGIYILFVQHRNVNAYANKLPEEITEEVVEEAPVEEHVHEFIEGKCDL